MAISDIQLKDDSGNWNSLFPISVAHGGTGATSAAAACRSIDAVRYDSTSSTSKVTDAVISAKSDANQPIRLSVDGAAGSYTLYFNKDGTIGFWDNDQAKTIWAIKFPVGYVYMSFSSTSPATLFGGTWSQISGRFLYCTTSTGTGGNNNHTLTADQLPKLGTQIWNFCGQSTGTALAIGTPSGYSGIGSAYGDNSMYFPNSRSSWSHTDGFKIAFGGAISQQHALISRRLCLEKNSKLIELVI